MLQILNILKDTDLERLGRQSADTVHLLAESMRIAYADRAEYLGDPDFVSVPVRALTSRSYAKFRISQIQMSKARPSSEVKAVDPQTLSRLAWESPETTHLTVVDKERNVVSLTFTVNGGFGAGAVASGTGILLNNEMDDFAAAPGVPNLFGLVGGEANAIAPGKTPLSSMTPIIVTENGKFRLAAGAPGGSTIITTVLQIVLNVLVYDMNVGDAVSAPRIHHQWMPDRLWVERTGLPAARPTSTIARASVSASSFFFMKAPLPTSAPGRKRPPGIRRLILVPDDALHQLPFAALRPSPGALPLAYRQDLTTVPSATLWLRWRRQPPQASAEPLLALRPEPGAAHWIAAKVVGLCVYVALGMVRRSRPGRIGYPEGNIIIS